MKTHDELVSQVDTHEARLTALENNLPEAIKAALRELVLELLTVKNLTKIGTFLVAMMTIAEKLDAVVDGLRGAL